MKKKKIISKRETIDRQLTKYLQITPYRSAINLHCFRCSYKEEDNRSWREQVSNCKHSECALFPVRPVITVKDIDL